MPIFGEVRTVLDWEKGRQRSLSKPRKQKKFDYSKELRKVCRKSMARYMSEHPWLKTKPRYNNEHFKRWLWQQPEYIIFRLGLVEMGIKIPGYTKSLKLADRDASLQGQGFTEFPRLGHN